jgi:hypothetical protein
MLEEKKVSTLQVSKWIKIPLLVDANEMRALVEQLPDFKIYDVQRVTASQEGIYAPSFFLESYESYITCLKQGEVPNPADFRAIFSAVWSVTDKALVSIPAQQGRRLLKAAEPSVQTQINQIRYAPEEKVFRTQVFSSDSISWGLQIGFPHLYMNPTTYEASKTRDFPNMALFMAIQRWIRQATVPTPFLIEGERINSPIRLGKECFRWISDHPQLKACGIGIDYR